MQLSDFAGQDASALPIRTICFLLKEDQILLGMKKRGFGVGKWNGFGGKLNPGETIEQGTVRETQEESLVTPQNLEKVAVVTFYFPYNGTEISGVTVHVYLSKTWSGEPEETEEMRPKWFALDQIPYAQMWPDDELWLPLILQGKKLQAAFLFQDEHTIQEYHIEEVDSL